MQGRYEQVGGVGVGGIGVGPIVGVVVGVELDETCGVAEGGAIVAVLDGVGQTGILFASGT